MTQNNFWDKIRLLVTDSCNYSCPFCHNEGQNIKHDDSHYMKITNVKKLINAIKQANISEICFSGGEPFLNKDLLDMIEYANNETNFDISCASNLSLLTSQHIQRLKSTRIKFNIQFPSANNEQFKKSTGVCGKEIIESKIKLLKDAKINVGLNSVIQNYSPQNVNDLVEYALEYEMPLKLLPQLGIKESSLFKNWVYPILEKYKETMTDKGGGATRWLIKKGTKKTVILYIESPCFDKNILKCKHYGELRILPDFTMQSCIFKSTNNQLKLNNGKEYIISQLQEQWNNFNQC